MKSRISNRLLIMSFLLILLSGNTGFIQAQSATKKGSTLETHLQKNGMVNIHTLDSTIKVELKYATTDNFTNVILYDTLSNAYLHPLAAKKLAKAQKYLK